MRGKNGINQDSSARGGLFSKPIVPYFFSILFVLLAAGLHQTAFSEANTAALLFLVAIFFSSWVGGLGPGLTATALSALLWLCLPYPLSLAEFLLFLTIGSSVAFVCDSRRREASTRVTHEDLNHAILDALSAHIAVLNSRGDIIAVNDSWTRFAMENDLPDLQRAGIDTNYLEICANSADPEARLARDGISGVLNGEQGRFVMEYPCHSPSEKRWFLLVASPLPGMAAPHERGAVVSHLDISSRRIAEIERLEAFEREKQAREEAEQLKLASERANRSKDVFLAVVSHELRTPINSILGWCLLLDGGITDEAIFKQGLEVIARNARAQASLVEDLLDISRIASDKLQIDPEPLDLGAVIQLSLDNLRPLAAEKDVALQAHLNATPHVNGDSKRLQQVVGNILHNAIKFSPAGSNVTLTLNADPVRQIAHLEIRDEGKGIKPEFLPQLFDQFSQEQNHTSRQHRGLGLGLSIVRHLVEAHSGKISAHSEGEGQGAIFTVELPLLSSAPA